MDRYGSAAQHRGRTVSGSSGSMYEGYPQGNLHFDPSMSFDERRQLVRDLRLAALRAAVGVTPGSPNSAGKSDFIKTFPQEPVYLSVSSHPVQRQQQQSPKLSPAVLRNSGWNSPINEISEIDSIPPTPPPVSQLDMYETSYKAGRPTPIKTVTKVTQEKKQVDGKVKVTEIHHHHHHHYYEAPDGQSNGNTASPRMSEGSPKTNMKTSPIRVTTKKNKEHAKSLSSASVKQPVSSINSSSTSTSPKSASSPEILEKAQLLLNAAKKTAESKKKKKPVSQKVTKSKDNLESQQQGQVLESKPKMQTSPVTVDGEQTEKVIEKKQEVAIQEGVLEKSKATEQPRRRSRTASVVLSELEKEKLAKQLNEEKLAQENGDDFDDAASDSSASKRYEELAMEAVQIFVPLIKPVPPTEDQVEPEDEDEVMSSGEVDSNPLEREAKFLEMLTEADSLQNEQSDPNLALIPFGQVLQRARVLSGSTLPKYASCAEDSPSRPPPEIVYTKGADNMDRRQFRSRSQGADPPRLPEEKDGWLFKMPKKKGIWGSSQTWKRRYFKLTGKLLLYMTSPDAKAPKGMLNLAKIEIETDPSKLGRTPTPHALLIYEKGKRNEGFKVCGSSFKEILGWYRSIVSNAVFFCFNVNSSRPPEDNTPLSNDERARRDDIKRKAALPRVAPPNPKDFYPLFQNAASHYDLLGVPTNATGGQIRKSFYKLAAKFHPDKNPAANPHDFALLASAYDILFDQTNRARYDLGEKVREALRRGFDCTIYVPTKYAYVQSGTGKKRVPAQLSEKKVTLFADGNILRLFHMDSTEKEFQPLQPNNDCSVEMRFVQRVMFGRNDKIVYHHFLRNLLIAETTLNKQNIDEVNTFLRSVDTFIVLQGNKLDHDFYIRLDSSDACKELVEGLRIIRCEASVLFKQTLEKLSQEGLD